MPYPDQYDPRRPYDVDLHDRTRPLRDLGVCRSKGPPYSETRTSASERLQGGLAGGRAGSIGRANDQDLLAVSKKEDDHDAGGSRQVDVADGCLGNVGHPRSYVCTAGGTTATGQLAIGWAGTCGIAGRPSRLGSSSRPTSVARARDESQAATYLAAE
jgi:hypothetical protein